MNKNNSIKFIHANGFPPEAYRTLFNYIKKEVTIDSFLLRPLDKSFKETHEEIKNWEPFSNDFINSLNNSDKIIGMGHSIGGNIILRTALKKPDFFSKIILLDPTLFIPKFIFLWRIIEKIGLQNTVHPWVRATLNRKMIYDSFDDIFQSYRKKKVFSKIDNNNLKIYIDSITKIGYDNKLYITYSKQWEYIIYKTGLVADMYIWKNLKNLKIQTLIIKAEESTAFYDSAAKKITKLNKKNIKIVQLDGSSHLFPFEQAKKTSEKILAFINN